MGVSPVCRKMLLKYGGYDDNNTPPSSGKSGGNDTLKEDTNKGTLTLDATCAPADIRYPQDISLLNEAREKLETIIYRFCKSYGLPLPRRYRRRARKDYLAFAKSKKHSARQVFYATFLQNVETGIKSSVFTKVQKQLLWHQCSGWHKL